MKTLILYATKHGAACEIAQRIEKKIGGAAIHDLKQGGAPSLAEFDCVIVGSSLYAGRIRKEAKAFLAQNADALKVKRLGLFLSGMDASREKPYFDANVAMDVLQAARAARFLGGIFDPQKAGAMERFIMKAVSKQSGYRNTISDDSIEQFVEAMTS
ncbi:MAG: flavodoxin domain-containing protein [Oscillospiraceae bacterium]|jgi:menaquinone-dependent protoporphyrinogen oxidase|nr:flavodoxin domain-containing protein [Oscillospiraceae bacterium]